MATTTKKSPKAKIKNAKRPVTKAAKATKKTVASKAVKAPPVKSAKKPAASLLAKLNLLSGVLSLGLAAAAGYLMSNVSYQLFTGMLTKDELASKVSTVFVPAIHAVYDVELRWVVVTILLLSAVVPLLAATRSRRQYEQSVANGVVLWRWIDMAVVGGLILETVALLSGVQDIMVLKLIAGSIVVTCLLGWISEKHNAVIAGTGRSTHLLSWVTGTLPWLIIAAYALGTVMFGMVRSPWYVYALYAATLASFLAYCFNSLRNLQAKQSYEVTERNYLQISIFLKVAFAVILIVGLYKK